MISDGDSVNTHFYNGVIIAARFGHVAKIENVFFGDF